jgi:hypothetical protein
VEAVANLLSVLANSYGYCSHYGRHSTAAGRGFAVVRSLIPHN